MTVDCTRDTGQKVRLSSLSQLDGRTIAAKEARDLAAALERDTGGDPSAALRVLIEQGACLSALCGDYGRRWLTGQLGADEVPSWLSSVNNLRRVLETIGLERRAKNVTLSQYLEQKARQRPPNDDEGPS
jgi:hypothetical protein